MPSNLPINLENLLRQRQVEGERIEYKAGWNPDLTESRSTGISKIIKAMVANGSPAPEFETDEDRSYFLIRLPVHAEATAWAEEGTPQETTQKTTQKSTQKTTQRILTLLREKPTLSRKEIAELLRDITDDGVNYQLNKLKLEGLIRRVGPDHGGHWEVIDKS